MRLLTIDYTGCVYPNISWLMFQVCLDVDRDLTAVSADYKVSCGCRVLRKVMHEMVPGSQVVW